MISCDPLPLITASKELNSELCLLRKNNEIEKAKELLEKNPELLITIGWFFASDCGRGFLRGAKNYLAIAGKIDDRYIMSACIQACGNGHMKTLNWLLSLPNININREYFEEKAFLIASTNGLVEPIKWLLDNGNISDSLLRCVLHNRIIESKNNNKYIELVEFLKNYNDRCKEQYKLVIEYQNLDNNCESDCESDCE